MDSELQKQAEKHRRMTEEPVGPLICRLAGPCIISMLVTAFYNMADTFFVGLLNSNSATGAVGVAFSLMAIIQAIGFFFGQGLGNFVSRELGRQNRRAASEMAVTGVLLSFLCGALLALLGTLFLTPLVRLLGATETILPYAERYVGFILLGAPWMTASLALNNLLRFQGSTVYSMVGVSAGAALNVALDPLLIFGLDLGVAGAAIATSVSQFVGFFLLLIGCARGDNLQLRLSAFRPNREYIGHLLRGGLPSLCRQGLNSVGMIVLNHSAGLYGDAAIAAITVVNRIMQTASSALFGFGQGFQPFCGFNYGARRYDRVRQGFWFCVKVSTAVLAALAVAGLIFAPQLVSLFRDDPQVIAYGAFALRLQCLVYPLFAWVVCSNMMLQTLNRTGPATFLATARQGLCLIPALLILTPLLDFLGVQLAQPMADVFTFLVSTPFQFRLLRELKAEEQAHL